MIRLLTVPKERALSCEVCLLFICICYCEVKNLFSEFFFWEGSVQGWTLKLKLETGNLSEFQHKILFFSLSVFYQFNFTYAVISGEITQENFSKRLKSSGGSYHGKEFTRDKSSMEEYYAALTFYWEGKISKKHFPRTGDFWHDLKNNWKLYKQQTFFLNESRLKIIFKLKFP